MQFIRWIYIAFTWYYLLIVISILFTCIRTIHQQREACTQNALLCKTCVRELAVCEICCFHFHATPKLQRMSWQFFCLMFISFVGAMVGRKNATSTPSQAELNSHRLEGISYYDYRCSGTVYGIFSSVERVQSTKADCLREKQTNVEMQIKGNVLFRSMMHDGSRQIKVKAATKWSERKIFSSRNFLETNEHFR